MIRSSALLIAILVSTGGAAHAGQPCPDGLATGSSDVVVEGRQAARTGDKSACGGMVVEGSSNVIINGQPALTVGSTVACPNGKMGTMAAGSSSVFINGKPMAGSGAKIVGCD